MKESTSESEKRGEIGKSWWGGVCRQGPVREGKKRHREMQSTQAPFSVEETLTHTECDYRAAKLCDRGMCCVKPACVCVKRERAPPVCKEPVENKPTHTHTQMPGLTVRPFVRSAANTQT